jgi:hypothetical protein
MLYVNCFRKNHAASLSELFCLFLLWWVKQSFFKEVYKKTRDIKYKVPALYRSSLLSRYIIVHIKVWFFSPFQLLRFFFFNGKLRIYLKYTLCSLFIPLIPYLWFYIFPNPYKIALFSLTILIQSLKKKLTWPGSTRFYTQKIKKVTKRTCTCT